jgi:hypothetical protein
MFTRLSRALYASLRVSLGVKLVAREAETRGLKYPKPSISNKSRRTCHARDHASSTITIVLPHDGGINGDPSSGRSDELKAGRSDVRVTTA